MSEKTTTIRVPIELLPEVRRKTLEFRLQKLEKQVEEIKEELAQIQSEPQPV